MGRFFVAAPAIEGFFVAAGLFFAPAPLDFLRRSADTRVADATAAFCCAAEGAGATGKSAGPSCEARLLFERGKAP